jgi:ribonuclease P protein subunit RPR2
MITNLLGSSPHIKRSICRACQVPLLAGITSKTRLDNSSKLQTPHNDMLVVECMVCGKKKRYPVGKEAGSELWVDKAKQSN